MKRIKFFILMLLLSATAYGETCYGELFCDGMTWVYRGRWTVESYFIDGSKVVNGKTYGLLHIDQDGYDGARRADASISAPSHQATIGIRDEGGRVYVDKEDYLGLLTQGTVLHNEADGDNLPYEVTEDGEIVLYDFNKNVGDVYGQMADGTTLTVTKTDVMKTEDGVTRRILILSNGFELIEGVGCNFSSGLMLFWLNTKSDYKDIGVCISFGIKSANDTYTAILAQDYNVAINNQNGITNKMLTKGRRWVYDYDNGVMKGKLTYYIDGDTLLQAYHRAKVCMTLVDSKTNKVVQSGYVGAFHQTGGHINYLAKGNSKDVVLYSFYSPRGQLGWSDIARYVVNTDDIEVNNDTYHRLMLLNYVGKYLPTEKDSLYYWVEGIGSSKGLFDYRGGALADSIQFVACYDGETRIFTNDDFYKDSGQPIQYGTSLWIESVMYYVDLSTKTASPYYSNYFPETFELSDNIVILPSVELFGINCVVDRIDDRAFYNLPGLVSVVIPEGVRKIGNEAFRECTGLTSVSLPSGLVSIGDLSFFGCDGLTSVILPDGLTTIGRCAFQSCRGLNVIDIPASVTNIDEYSFTGCDKLENVYCRAATPPNTNGTNQFHYSNPEAILHVPAASLQAYKETAPWRDFKYIVPLETELAYRPFIEDGKVWKVGALNSGNPVQLVEYYYFDGDTIIDGKTCKQMMRQRYERSDSQITQWPLVEVGVWYEEDKKVYILDDMKRFVIMYDFSLNANDTLRIYKELPAYVIGPRQTGGINGFKGVYRNVMMCLDEGNLYSPTWLEGVGSIDGPLMNVYSRPVEPVRVLMGCTVGDEVIYFNDEYEDGATPDAARKQRIDFNHTIKTKPKAPRKEEAEPSLYGEYNNLQLDINLNPLADAYVVRITDETGKAVYEKAIDAASIVGLNIDISSYSAGRYTVTVENSSESFTGEFETQLTGISDTLRPTDKKDKIYNLQGQRISTSQKGLRIEDGRLKIVK